MSGKGIIDDKAVIIDDKLEIIDDKAEKIDDTSGKIDDKPKFPCDSCHNEEKSPEFRYA